MNARLAATPDTVLARFVAQHERPRGVTDVDFATLSPYHRCLLITDGNVTSLLEAYALEPTRTRCLDQQPGQPTPSQVRWLCLDAGTTTVARRVVIEGVRSNAAYLSASSLLVPGRLPASFVDSLSYGQASIGTALIKAALEHRRELLWFNHSRGSVASRTYRVFVQGSPVLLITEEFLR